MKIILLIALLFPPLVTHHPFHDLLSIKIRTSSTAYGGPPVLIIVLNLISNKIIYDVMGKFHTGQSVPSTGTYHFAGHVENSTCQPTENEKRIQLAAGESFPPCRHCKTGAFWEIRL
jgi:hypothetical protein